MMGYMTLNIPGYISYQKNVFQSDRCSAIRSMMATFPGLTRGSALGLLDGTLTYRVESDRLIITE